MRAAIARDQKHHWWELWWQPAPTKKEVARRERLWFRWRCIQHFAELEEQRSPMGAERSLARGR
jgi:hypothetical protein